MTVFWRYWLLQVPGWGVLGAVLLVAHRWFDLSYLWIVVITVSWLVKDWALYPVLARHYRARDHAPGETMVGCRGVAEEALGPRGYVRVRGELWLADVDDGSPVERGEEVVVEAVDVDGLILRVKRGRRPQEA